MFGPLCSGHLAQAAAHVAEFGRRVVIVTGFFIPAGDPPAAETDGPPGALLLAQTLLALEIDARLLTDSYCFSAVAAAAAISGFPSERLMQSPLHVEGGAADQTLAEWRSDFLRHEVGAGLSHLIAIERVGPSHTAESLARQQRSGEVPLQRFIDRVPAAQRDCCHNMRGENIGRFTGNLHRLFEEIAEVQPEVKTIGIGDGANEIGMGTVPWEELERRLSGEHAARVPCRIAADWNIVAGTSNWGGYALAAAAALLRDQVDSLAAFDSSQQQMVLEAMVAHGPAVDGVTRRREPTVDGLPFLTYIQPWEEIRAKLGL